MQKKRAVNRLVLNTDWKSSFTTGSKDGDILPPALHYRVALRQETDLSSGSNIEDILIANRQVSFTLFKGGQGRNMKD